MRELDATAFRPGGGTMKFGLQLQALFRDMDPAKSPKSTAGNPKTTILTGLPPADSETDVR